MFTFKISWKELKYLAKKTKTNNNNNNYHHHHRRTTEIQFVFLYWNSELEFCIGSQHSSTSVLPVHTVRASTGRSRQWIWGIYVDSVSSPTSQTC